MKIFTILWLVLAALVVVLNYAAHYWLGYSETPAVFALSDHFFGLMTEFALFLVYIIPAIWTELVKRGRLWSFVGVLGFWPVVIVTFYLLQTFGKPEGELIAQGLCDRVTRDFKLDDLRQFAKDVDQEGILKNQDLVSQADTSGFTPAQREALTKLGAKYPFMHWLDDEDKWFGPSLLDYAQDGVVDFDWGGGSRGRWGCSISINGSKNEPLTGAPAKVVRVSDDIYFYYRK